MEILRVSAVLLESLAILADRDNTAMSTDEIGAGSYPLREDGGENAGFFIGKITPYSSPQMIPANTVSPRLIS